MKKELTKGVGQATNWTMTGSVLIKTPSPNLNIQIIYKNSKNHTIWIVAKRTRDDILLDGQDHHDCQ